MTKSREGHESLYRKTIGDALDGIRNESYTPENVPRIINDLRGELGACLELLLVSEEFYVEQMEILQKGVATESDR